MDSATIFRTTCGAVGFVMFWAMLLAGWCDDRAKARRENQTPDLLKEIPETKSHGDIKTSHTWRKTPDRDSGARKNSVEQMRHNGSTTVFTTHKQRQQQKKILCELNRIPAQKLFFSLHQGQGAGYSSKTSRPSLKNSLTTKRTT